MVFGEGLVPQGGRNQGITYLLKQPVRKPYPDNLHGISRQPQTPNPPPPPLRLPWASVSPPFFSSEPSKQTRLFAICRCHTAPKRIQTLIPCRSFGGKKM